MDIYNRAGQLIDMDEWYRLFGDLEYRVVGRTVVGRYLISTVWLGLDHQFGQGPPKFFETMVFPATEDGFVPVEYDVMRYCNEDEALTGHRQYVELIMATTVTIEEFDFHI